LQYRHYVLLTPIRIKDRIPAKNTEGEETEGDSDRCCSQTVCKCDHAIPTIEFSFYHSRYETLPPPWKKYVHLSGEIYYYHEGLRLVTPDNIYDPATLEKIIDTRNEHVELLDDEGVLDELPEDWECLLFGSDVSGGPLVKMHSWREGKCYKAFDDG